MVKKKDHLHEILITILNALWTNVIAMYNKIIYSSKHKVIPLFLKMVGGCTCMLIIGRAGASPPSRASTARTIYIYIYIYLDVGWTV